MYCIRCSNARGVGVYIYISYITADAPFSLSLPLPPIHTWTPLSIICHDLLPRQLFWNVIQKHSTYVILDLNACCISRWLPWQRICKWMCVVLCCVDRLAVVFCHTHDDKTRLVRLPLTGLKEPTIERWFVLDLSGWDSPDSLSGGVGTHGLTHRLQTDLWADHQEHERWHHVKLGMNLH
jgi:hypothetical protein